MFFVQLENFRCFANSGPIEVRPLTFLVGENSAGKTTFLAALRQLLESFIRIPQNPFNREPYFLGGFDQIAHYRGGRFGRAEQFTLSLMIPGSDARQLLLPGIRKQSEEATWHSFTFSRGAPQPDLSKYEFRVGNKKAILEFSGPKIKVRMSAHDTESSLQFDPKRLPPVELLRRDMSYLRYVFDEIYFGILQSRDNQEDNRPELSEARDLFSRFRESHGILTQRTFASAPVRTEPLRTYTPSEVTPSSEGAHVPLDMARQKTASPDAWKKIQQELSEFGKNAGLFDSIDIRLLGKKDGDPFQVLIKTKGPPVNLVDVGYGVSQALPIVHQLQRPSDYRAFLLQQPEVHLHPRAQAELGTLLSTLSRQRSASLYVIETHSDYIIDRVRMEVARGKLKHERVSIIYFRREKNEIKLYNIYLSSTGEIQNAPKDFRSFFLEEHARLLGL
jgi:predicted ATPase